MTTILSNTISFIGSIFTYLWLSVSSIKFYENILKKQDNYGASYILNLSLMSALVCTLIFMYKVNEVQNYLKYNVISNSVENFDYVLKQIPPIDYDGHKIQINNSEPLIIKNKNNTNILALDPNNQIRPGDRNKFPLIVAQNKIIIKLMDSEGEIKNSFPIKLDQIFSPVSKIITQEDIKYSLSSLLDQAPRLLIYITFPLMSFLIFLNTFLDKSFLIIILFFVSRLSSMNISMKSCIRLAMYSSGFYALFQLIFVLIANEYSSLIWIVQSWCNILMILGILKAKGRNQFFKR